MSSIRKKYRKKRRRQDIDPVKRRWRGQGRANVASALILAAGVVLTAATILGAALGSRTLYTIGWVSEAGAGFLFFPMLLAGFVVAGLVVRLLPRLFIGWIAAAR